MASEVTLEKYAAATGIPESVLRDYWNGRSTVKWHHADARALSNRQVLLTVSAGDALGNGKRPRTVPNPDYTRNPTKSVHETRGASSMKVDPVKHSAILGMAHPSPQDIQGDPALRVVSGEGMPKGFKVLRRTRRAADSAQKGSRKASRGGVNVPK